MMARWRLFVKRGWPPIAAILAMLIVWQLAVLFFEIEKWLLPGPIDIAREMAESFPRLMMHTTFTIRNCLIGFAVGACCGIVTALAMHLFRPLKSTLAAVLVFTQNIPIIVLGPLLVVWFGFGLLPKVVIIALVCYFPIAVSTMNGLADPDHAMKNYMRMLGASRSQLLFKLEIPHSLRHLFSGLKISATYSVMGAVISEWLGASRGIGYFMTLSSSAYRTDRVFASIVIIVALSLLFYAVIELIERAVIRWKPQIEREEE